MKEWYPPKVRKAVDARLNHPAVCTPVLRQAVEAHAARLSGGTRDAHEVPADLVAYVDKVTRYAYKITPPNLARMNQPSKLNRKKKEKGEKTWGEIAPSPVKTKRGGNRWGCLPLFFVNACKCRIFSAKIRVSSHHQYFSHRLLHTGVQTIEINSTRQIFDHKRNGVCASSKATIDQPFDFSSLEII